MLRKHSYVQAMENGLFEEWTALERERIEEEKQISLKVQPQTSTTIKIIRSNVEMIHSNNEEENRSEAVVLRPRTGNMEQVAGERRSIMEMFNLEQNGIGENEEYKDLLVKAEEEDKEILATKRLSSGIVPDELEPVTEDRDTNTNSITIPMIENSENSSSFHVVYTGRNSIRKSRRSPENGGIRAKTSRRVVFRNGDVNVPLILNIPEKHNKFMKDIVTTLIDCRWRWITLLFALSHFIVWFVFALMFYLSAYVNGDLSDNPGPILCITDGKTFTGIFGFSVETQVSIGYGEKSPTEECPEVAFVIVMEVVVGYILLGIIVGIVFAKSVRPKKYITDVGFSKNIVICMRNGKMCLVFRVWDFQENHVIGTNIKALVVKHVVAGPVIQKLTLSPDNPLIFWPTTIQHEINEQSPLYDLSAKDFVDKRLEIIITLTGASKRTGQMTQSRTSYISKDILWGQRFKNVLSYDVKESKFKIDVKLLNAVQPIDVPLCSARLLDKLARVDTISPLSSIGSPNWSFKFSPKTPTATNSELNEDK